MIKPSKLKKEIKLPEGVTADFDSVTYELSVSGKLGTIKKRFISPNIKIEFSPNNITILPLKNTRREKSMINSIAAHIKNMIYGVQNGYTYKLRICSSHFPITATIDGARLLIKNFVGERVPRAAIILDGVKVKVDGNDIIVEGYDLEKVSQTAANIEIASKRSGYDKRVFQDGIYIYQKDHSN